MLDYIDIEGLKGVGRVELRFASARRVRVLFGVNGVGKTKSLEAIYLAYLFTHEVVLREKGRNGIRVKPWWPFSKITVDGKSLISDLSDLSDVVHVNQLASIGVRHDKPLVYIGAGGRSSVGPQSKSISALGDFEQRREAHVERLLGECSSGLRLAGMASDVRGWFVQRAQSVNPFQVEKDNLRGEIDAVLGLLNKIDSRVDSGRMQIDGAQRVFLSIESRMVELGELSSGFASVVKLFQAIISGFASFTNSKDLQHLPGLVLIDEIESHLHVSWQTTIVKRLKELFPNTKFLISTHSPLVLTQLEQGEAYLLERDEVDGIVRAREIDSPNMKAFADVLEETFGVDLNALKREALATEDQGEVKRALLELAKRNRLRRAGGSAD